LVYISAGKSIKSYCNYSVGILMAEFFLKGKGKRGKVKGERRKVKGKR
jgi:hypothetical protein